MKLILITGANGQVGNYLARQYHSEGYSLALLYHHRDDRLKDLKTKTGIMMEQVDLQDLEKLQDALQRILSHFGKAPEILIHTAAVRSFDAMPLYLSEAPLFRHILDANILSAYNILRCTLSFMKESGWGRVILFGSNVTHSGLKCGSAYAAAKSAIVSLVKSTAQEMAPFGILINAISPGPVETVLEEDYQGEYLKFRQQYFETQKKKTPTGKLVQMVEIKKMTDMLISPELLNLTGEELMIRGGLQ